MKKRVVKCTAEWCNSCKAMSPIFNRIEKEFPEFDFQELDVESDEGVDFSIKYHVRNVPTIIILDENDNMIDRVVGTKSFDELKNIIEKWK